MTKERILEILDGAKDKTASVPMSLVRKAFENISNEQQWILCSERLPQKSGNYIVTERRYSVDDRKHEGKYQTIVEGVRFTGEKWERAKFFDIIAWMPLPSPYQPDGFTKWAKSVADSYRNDKEESE